MGKISLFVKIVASGKVASGKGIGNKKEAPAGAPLITNKIDEDLFSSFQ
jgi:hypothetical protein